MQWKIATLALIVFCAGYVSAEETAQPTVQPDGLGQNAVGSQTDSEAVERESEAISATGLSAKEQEEADSTQETHEFQAEVNRLMDIIINSLYSNREIFIRELISNAADATDKIRHMALTDPDALGEGDVADLDIKISFDKEAKTLSITDKGVGMTKQDLLKNLGVVAKSGTTEFLEAANSKDSDSLSLIGQFGVGFYSVYLVADKVTVVSKNNADEQHVWESTANSVFTVAKDPRGNTLGRGTSIILQLKEDADEFLNEGTLEKLVKRYSQFINFPILLKTIKEEQKEVPIEEDEAEATEETEETEETEGEDDLEVTEEDDEEAPKTKTITETTVEWKRLNDVKAIWTRNPKDITDEEYNSFYRTLTNKANDPLEHIHFLAEGEITFKSLLYIPKEAVINQYADSNKIKLSGIKLYVRRVLISDEFEDFLPRYLNFVKGIVDSDDLPLNVSRETLAQSRVLKVMSKKLVRKVLELLKKMAERSKQDDEEDDEEGEESGEGDEPLEVEQEEDAYEAFWKAHGKSIKFGVIDDRKNKSKLTKLLRYITSKSDGKAIALEDYVERMKEDQKSIYYITGESLEKVKKSPFLEKILSKGYEVVYMVDPLDEYVVQSMTEYDGVELMSVTKEGLKIGSKDEKKKQEKLKEEFKPLITWFKKIYGGDVEKVTVSNRLGKSPCVLVTGQYGWSANMQRIMMGATLNSGEKNGVMQAKRTFEINPRHPIMTTLLEKIEDNAEDETLVDLAKILLDAAVVASGFTIDDYASFNTRMSRVVKTGLGMDPNIEAPEEPEEDEEEEAEEEADEEVEAEDDAPAEDAPAEDAPAHEEL